MGEDNFMVYELIKQTGDDGLPHHLLQIDIEGEREKFGEKGKHIARIFVPVAEVKQLFFEKGI